MKMENHISFDKILLEDIGQFSLYQKIIMLLVACAAINVTTQNFIHTFTGSYPDIVCTCHNKSQGESHLCVNNQSLQLKYELLSKRYPNFSMNADKYYNETEKSAHYEKTCSNTEFSQKIYKSTIVTEWFGIQSKDAKWLSAMSQSLHMFGCFIGSIMFGYLTDMYGRRKLLLLTSLCSGVAGIVCAFSNTFWLYSALRMIIGMFVAGEFNTAYVVAMEIVGPAERQYAAVSMLLCSSVGVMSLAAAAHFIRHWHHLQIAMSLPTLLMFLVYAMPVNASSLMNRFHVLSLIPESPRWLINQNRIEEATAVINTIMKFNNKPVLTVEYIKRQKYDNSEDENIYLKQRVKSKRNLRRRSSVFDLVRTSNMRKYTMLITFLWFTVSTSYYGLSLYSSSLGGNVYLNMFLSGAIEVPAYVFSAVICRYWGYKNPLAMSLLIAGVILVANLFASANVAARIVFTLVGKFGISITYSVIYPFATELFPTVVRTIGLGATSTGARVGAFLAPYINLLETYHKMYPLAVFGLMAILGTVSVIFLPETKGRLLPESVQDVENTPSILSRLFQRKPKQLPTITSESITDESVQTPIALQEYSLQIDEHNQMESSNIMPPNGTESLQITTKLDR